MQVLCMSFFLCQTHQGSDGSVSVVSVRARIASVHQRQAGVLGKRQSPHRCKDDKWERNTAFQNHHGNMARCQ